MSWEVYATDEKEWWKLWQISPYSKNMSWEIRKLSWVVRALSKALILQKQNVKDNLQLQFHLKGRRIQGIFSRDSSVQHQL